MSDKHTTEQMHDEIWLQCPNKDGMSEWYGEVTWCDSPQNDDDTKYVRADLYETVTKQRDELLAALEKFIDSHEECTDFDGFTAQIVSMDDYHEAQKSFDRVKYHGQPEKQPENESGEVGK